jgi:hypothetical protein
LNSTLAIENRAAWPWVPFFEPVLPSPKFPTRQGIPGRSSRPRDHIPDLIPASLVAALANIRVSIAATCGKS